MADHVADGNAGGWRIDWAARRTRVKVLLFTFCVSLALVVGSLVGLFPEALVFAFLTGNGHADASGWGAALAGNFVQLLSVLLALATLDRVMRWMTPDSAELDGIDVLDMDESLRRVGRMRFLFLVFLVIAIPTQFVILLSENLVVFHLGWIDGAFLQTWRFPQATYLLFAEGFVIGALRRFLATNAGA